MPYDWEGLVMGILIWAWEGEVPLIYLYTTLISETGLNWDQIYFLRAC